MLQRVEHPSASCGQPSSFAIWLQVHLHPLPRTRYRSGDDCAQDDRWREDKKVSDATLTGDQFREVQKRRSARRLAAHRKISAAESVACGLED